MNTYHVKKGDKVYVNSGKWKGEVAVIGAVLTKKDRVVLNFTDGKSRDTGMRTLKKSQARPNGGRIERSVSVHISNVVLYREPAADNKTE